MYTLITFATQWGSKYGGINSFNADFLKAFGVAYDQKAQVICIVANATVEEKTEAAGANVKLVTLPYPPQAKAFNSSIGKAGADEIRDQKISFDPEKTVWLGHDRITGEAAIAAAKIARGRSAVIHHMSYDHYESYAENSQSAHSKTQAQNRLFQEAHIALAVGPLLRDAARDRIGDSKNIQMLIPGLADIEAKAAPNTFVAFLSGRLSDDAARIKQGHLGVAAFAKAQREALENDMPEAFCKQPKLLLRGVDFDGQVSLPAPDEQQDPETELKQFAATYADAVVNLHALPYTQDREQLYRELCSASVALMPSWHEGFGLVAWEAIAAGVPLIISENSGVYRLLEEEYPGAGTGCVFPTEIRGAMSSPYFHEEDLKAVVNKLKEVANNPSKARKKASILRNMLGEYTWAACAEQATEAFDWDMEKGSLPIITPENLPQTPNVNTFAPAASDVKHTVLQIPTEPSPKEWTGS
jgi:glycosyltransferase involved in cell wall biosynthesis